MLTITCRNTSAMHYSALSFFRRTQHHRILITKIIFPYNIFDVTCTRIYIAVPGERLTPLESIKNENIRHINYLDDVNPVA